MVKKIEKISNFGVFKNFEWDKSFNKQKNERNEFRKINIIYGMNYSGKTTLSRIFRGLETGNISDKYKDYEFSILMEDNAINQNNLKEHNKNIKVFNEDFIKENLRFIYNNEDSIEPFAIIGEDNVRIEEEIKNMKEEIGSNKEGEETGLYKKFSEKWNIYIDIDNQIKSKEKLIEDKLRIKATDKNMGIKYKSERFGDINYDIGKLKNDIKTLEDGAEVISETDKSNLEKLILETSKEDINIHVDIVMFHKFKELKLQTKELVESKVFQTEKIEELAVDILLNSWVREGVNLHKQNKRDTCAFCGNPLSVERWDKLEKHFSESYRSLENSINELIKSLDMEKSKNIDLPDENKFYSTFYSEEKEILSKCQLLYTEYKNTIENFIKQLKDKKNNLLNIKIFEEVSFDIEEFQDSISVLKKLKEKSNEYSKNLKAEQKKAKEQLRLKEVNDYLNTIDYYNIIKEIEELKNSDDYTNPKYKEIEAKINEKIRQIEDKKKELNNEEKGAEKVNEYLSHFFRNNHLNLTPVQVSDINNNIQTKFEIKRNGVKAFHLSEGENRLIAFCYFMAKLHDISGEKIIWIDDPISSLDSNHIFFVYSLIDSEIVNKKLHKQLFISTHNLNFFKYLKKLDNNNEHNNKKLGYFIVERNCISSGLTLMPDYMSKYVTEFNYLFKQIYECSKIEITDDTNYHYINNFGNNARKFLELFLYYKYPHYEETDLYRYKSFFNDDTSKVSFISRILNESSHLSGVVERGESINENSNEIINAAKIILKQMLENDKEQYNALLKSIEK